ncbi:hypothetical protein IE81DRAFT_42589 [Ceraceosorus guamensis]|uniref:Uncharacterized protein n=1 Tax=Ceraceosorus guamensis TaxID=1522189 RepID=A0A316VNS4_9BASI|nr:hypothetical protein IE81DRAFT_42589 [Ceraceosorus guamensis]PWN39182.1 hypothetical protein IE81DRAFT_42589 [Ceraceosorus guamensis]
MRVLCLHGFGQVRLPYTNHRRSNLTALMTRLCDCQTEWRNLSQAARAFEGTSAIGLDVDLPKWTFRVVGNRTRHIVSLRPTNHLDPIRPPVLMPTSSANSGQVKSNMKQVVGGAESAPPLSGARKDSIESSTSPKESASTTKQQAPLPPQALLAFAAKRLKMGMLTELSTMERAPYAEDNDKHADSLHQSLGEIQQLIDAVPREQIDSVEALPKHAHAYSACRCWRMTVDRLLTISFCAQPGLPNRRRTKAKAGPGLAPILRCKESRS